MSTKKQPGRLYSVNHKQQQEALEQLLKEKFKDKSARFSTAESLLDLSVGWDGDDLEDCLEAVRQSRSKVEF